MAIRRKDTEERVTEGGDKLIHPHPMQFLDLENLPNYSKSCKECGLPFFKKAYGCLSCRYFIHPSCHPVQKLEKEVQSLCHPCLLIGYNVRLTYNILPGILAYYQGTVLEKWYLTETILGCCNVCGRRARRDEVIFHCNKCDFNLDPECIHVSPATPSNIKTVPDLELQSSTKYFSHKHPLILYNNIPEDRVECGVCGKYCSNNAYGCLPCAFFLDPSCAELKLPLKIYHPFHLSHPLFLLEQKGHRGKCNACRKDTPSVAYICKHDNCGFILDINCREVRVPTIKYEVHSHLLHFRERTDDRLKRKQHFSERTDNRLKCNACDKSSESSIFSCLYCDWNIHYTCGPLPNSITHECHEHPLVLTNALAEHEDEMDDEFYCDVCEKQRDQLLRSYQCIGCNFVAEIGCVKSEVMSLLNGNCGDHVELRDPFEQLGKLIMPPENTTEDHMMENKEEQSEPTLSLSKILKSLNEDESKELRRVLAEVREIRQTVNAEEKFFNDPGEDNILRFSDKHYTQFIKFLDRGTEISLELRDGGADSAEVLFTSLDKKSHTDYFALEEEVVTVGKHYKAARTFAPIMRILLSKHGDISAASKLSPNVKLFFLNMLCGCIYSMRNTKVVDITADMLLIWWTSLRTCKEAGFEIQPLVDHLKRVAHAFFGLYIGKQADKVERDIAKLEELKRNRDFIASSTKPDSVKECLREASVLKQGKAITERLWDKVI
ncbi:hypothetical protein I3843_05G197900 [Carya illinoinensis]|nr:hypothetical protein I3843_05G197900 [Carya illinoinensis]